MDVDLQAQLMHEALKARGVPTALVMFEGEQHGFRQAANIRWVGQLGGTAGCQQAARSPQHVTLGRLCFH